jgi:hypothetical protein
MGPEQGSSGHGFCLAAGKPCQDLATVDGCAGRSGYLRRVSVVCVMGEGRGW